MRTALLPPMGAALLVASCGGGASNSVSNAPPAPNLPAPPEPLAAVHNAASASSSGFSFDVYGDSRSMMYLPYKMDQERDARKLMAAPALDVQLHDHRDAAIHGATLLRALTRF